MTAITDAKLTVQQGPEPGKIFSLAGGSYTIGRVSGDIVIGANVVSRQHARVFFQGEQYFIEDLGSGNGTFLNGERVSGPEALHDGDIVSLGQSVALLFSGAAAPDRTMLEAPPEVAESATVLEAPAPPAAAPSEPPQLIVAIAGEAAVTHTLTKDSISIGRSTDNDIVVSMRLVSRFHARLVKQEDGYVLDPSQSASNPVLINDEPVTAAIRLRPGMEFRIGRHDSDSTALFTYQSSEVAPAAPQPLRTEVQPLRTEVERPAEPARPAAPKAVPLSALPRQAAPAPPADGGTMMEADFQFPGADQPPQLEVTVAGNQTQTYALTKSEITIGRTPENDIVIDSKIVSRQHGILQKSEGTYRFVQAPSASNPVLYEGRELSGPQPLLHGDKLRIGGLDPGTMVTMRFVAPSLAAAALEARTLDFGSSDTISIGRDASNDVVLDIPIVSRYHAQIERVGQRFRIRDQRSSNGTFVNGKRIEGEVWLKANDSVRVGPYRFVVGQDSVAQFDDSGGLRVEAIGLNKWVRKDLNILQNISLVFQPREFVVVVGQSGGGKSTLVDSIAGYRPATHGQVLVNDVDVYKNFDAIRNDIGFVPQRDIIHSELTVFQALDYTAQLRMPPDTTKKERHERVMEVLEDLDLAHRKDVQISGLSGGQQKRVSIGVELLTRPGLFFLDEPTSGLDPGTETALMQLMRRLADQGRTIVLITHATKNVMLADKVVFLARGGYLVWFGPPDEALAYFNQYRSEREQRSRSMEFDEIYAILEDSSKGSPQDWQERFAAHRAYKEYIEEPLREKAPAGVPAAKPATPDKPKQKKRRQVSSLRQFQILSLRNIRILTRDKFSLFLMLAVPWISLIDVILGLVLGRDPFGRDEGNMVNVLLTLFFPAMYAVMIGGLAQMREIVKEQDIYKRERLVNLRIIPYVLSKIWVAAILAIYHAAVYTAVHYVAFQMPGGVVEFLIVYVSLALAAMAGMMLGLFVSSLAPNANSAPLMIISLITLQIVFGGALVPLPSVVTSPFSTRWAFQGLMAVTGPGSDVAADTCWSLPEEQRALLTLEQKAQPGCICMGQSALDPDSCNYPGMGQIVLADPPPPPEEPDVEPPPPLRPQPETPVFPDPPEEPADESDLTAVADYLDALEAYNTEIEQIRTAAEADAAAWQAEAELFQTRQVAYETAQAEYQVALKTWEGQNQAALEIAVVSAETMINQPNTDFGWTFVDKNNTTAFYSTIALTWIAQMVIITILMVGILIFQKRKDAN